jgi:hypothetical protein
MPELWFFKLKVVLVYSNILWTTHFSPYFDTLAACEAALAVPDLPISVVSTLPEESYEIKGWNLCWNGHVEAWDFEHGWADKATWEGVE